MGGGAREHTTKAVKPPKEKEEPKGGKKKGKETAPPPVVDEFADDGGGKKGKGKKDAKKEGMMADKEEAALRKAEAKKLAEDEEESLSTYGKKPAKTTGSKVTAAQRATKRDEDAKATEQLLEKRKQESKRETSEGDYDKMVSVENTNRTERSIDASGIDNVVKQLGEVGLGASTAPESPGFVKRSKGVYSAYEEKMMAQLKEDSPGLKLSQYKEMIFKSWKKAPENPDNMFM